MYRADGRSPTKHLWQARPRATTLRSWSSRAATSIATPRTQPTKAIGVHWLLPDAIDDYPARRWHTTCSGGFSEDISACLESSRRARRLLCRFPAAEHGCPRGRCGTSSAKANSRASSAERACQADVHPRANRAAQSRARWRRRSTQPARLARFGHGHIGSEHVGRQGTRSRRRAKGGPLSAFDSLPDWRARSKTMQDYLPLSEVAPIARTSVDSVRSSIR
jgi:hypothetical protein